jgi:hypothetical protein
MIPVGGKDSHTRIKPATAGVHGHTTAATPERALLPVELLNHFAFGRCTSKAAI